MRTFLLATLLAAGACSTSASTDHAAKVEAAVPTVTIAELDTMLAAGAGQAVDANGDVTRKKLGVIPGAVLLSDYETFLPRELPADRSRTLVFYCANTRCSASDEAAAKARTAGYTSVKVLPEGIAGWVKAGKPTQAR